MSGLAMAFTDATHAGVVEQRPSRGHSLHDNEQLFGLACDRGLPAARRRSHTTSHWYGDDVIGGLTPFDQRASASWPPLFASATFATAAGSLLQRDGENRP
jgi:hypothetical protein